MILQGCLILSIGTAPADEADDASDLEKQATAARVEQRLARAEKWTTLRKIDLAIQELEYALQVDPESFRAWMAIAKAHLKNDDLKNAFSSAEKALALSEAKEERAEALALRGDLYVIYKGYEFANEDYESLFALVPDHARIDWYLRCAYALRMSDRFTACEEILHKGYEETGSALLHLQWIEALIDIDECELALEKIEEHVPKFGFRGDWLVRRALAYRKLEDQDKLLVDLREALNDLDERLEVERGNSDIDLFVNRATAHLLLGELGAARADYYEAISAGADVWMLWRLERALD